MQVTARTEYAMRAMVDLASGDGERTTVEAIAARQCIPPKILPAIVHALARAGLVETTRGYRGGVRLARPAGQISVKTVWEAVEGPLEFYRCKSAGAACPIGLGRGCLLRKLWERTRSEVLRQWQETSLADLARPRGRTRLRRAQGRTAAGSGQGA